MHPRDSRQSSSMTLRRRNRRTQANESERGVERPALIGFLRDRHRRPRSQRALAATTLAHDPSLLVIQPMHLLQVHAFPLVPERIANRR